MRRFIGRVILFAQVLVVVSCASVWKNSTYTDDLYSVHNKISIANRQKAEAELAKAQYEAQQAQYEATLAKIKAEASKRGIAVADDSSFNGYDAVLADSYESAYARRLYGFSSPTYRMPSSYYDWRYSDAFHYASAYDPAFYNIMVSGDMVWVEPKYVTSMFGSWGAAVVPSYGWYYGWSDPFYYWNTPYPYGWGWNRYWGWDFSFYWGYPYPHHHHYYPHRPSYRPPHSYPPFHGGVGNTGHQHNRPGAIVGRNPGASRPADRGGSVAPSRPSSGRGSQPAYRGGSTSSGRYNSGSSSYRDNSGRSSSRSNSSGSSSIYRAPSSAPSGGGYRSPAPSGGGGGNSRGR